MANPSPNLKGLAKRFAYGNKFGRGNPLGGKIEKLRTAIVQAATPADFKAIADALISEAKAGNVQAAKELFDRVLGKSTQTLNVNEAAGKPVATPERLARAAATILEFGGKLERLPPMLRAAYEQQRRAKQVDSAVIDAEET